MKANCKTLKLSILICVINLLLIVFFVYLVYHYDAKIFEILLNISIGFLGSGGVAFLLSISPYTVSKRQLIEKYLQETKELVMQISNIQFLFNEYDEANLISYLEELKSEKWKVEYAKAKNEVPILEKEKYKKRLIEEYIYNRPNLRKELSNAALYQSANESIDQSIEKMRKMVKKISKQYVEVAKNSTMSLSFILGDMEFFSGKKQYEKMHNNFYKPLYDIMAEIKEESFHFELFLNGEGNELVVLEKILCLQKKIFSVKIEEIGSFKSYIINSEVLNHFLIEAEMARADLYGIDPEIPPLYPIQCRRVYK